MAALTQIIGSYSFPQVMLLGIVVFFLYLVYLKMTDDDYYSELQDLKSKYKARMWSYLSGELRIVESTSLGNVSEILNVKELDEDDELYKEYIMFSLVLERNLYSHVYESIKTAVRVNGFHDMNESELTVYIREKSLAILEDSRKNINDKSMYYPSLRGTDEKRFSVEQARTFFDKVVRKSVKLYQKEKEDIKELKKKYSLWAKINFIGAIINKFKK